MAIYEYIIGALISETVRIIFKSVKKKPLTDRQKEQVEMLKDVCYNTFINYKQPYDDNEFATSFKVNGTKDNMINEEWRKKTVYIDSISLFKIQEIMKNIDFPTHKFINEKFELFYDNQIGIDITKHANNLNDGLINTDCVIVSLNRRNQYHLSYYKFIPSLPTFGDLLIVFLRLKEKLQSIE